MNLQAVLTDFGKQKGTDYQPEDLLHTAQLTDYYPDTTQPQASSYKTGSTNTAAQGQPQEAGTLAAIPPSGGGGAYYPPRVVYYYHPDYLGNVEYITDADGLPYQYFWYGPWGENLKEEIATTNGWSSPYRFNGKEVDRETGLAYYGARYYNPQVSVWLSVDAMASKGPNITPYAFTHNNPIMLVDLDGNWPFLAILTYSITNGVMSGTSEGKSIINNITSETKRPAMKSIDAIVLHRTAGGTAESAINTSKNNKGKTGFHLIVHKDGTITQINNLENRANHVGGQKGKIGNNNSIGIEVVGMALDKNGNPTNISSEVESWEALTCEQSENTAQAVAAIMIEYNLSYEDIYPHEDVSWKTKGEGQTVLDAIRTRVGELMQEEINRRADIEAIQIHLEAKQEEQLNN